jgi:hypothetical protein
MSDTPLTDILLIAWDMNPPSNVIIDHSRLLERKLNAANEHIRRLEEAGDAMENEGWNEPHLAGAWRKAKEKKP